MNADNQVESHSAISRKGIQSAVSGNPAVDRQTSADSGRPKLIGGWKNITCDAETVRAGRDTMHASQEAEAPQRQLRKAVGSAVLDALSKRELTASNFDEMTRGDDDYWRKWLRSQLKNDRLVLEDGVYGPGPQWVVMFVSMR
jgi:hypothetical protein